MQKYEESGEAAIGIDLGTTNSCVAVWQDGGVTIIPNENGNKTTPSYVAFTDTERLVGESAKLQVGLNPENTIFDAKRLIGRQFEDGTVQEDLWYWPFTILNAGACPMFEVEYKREYKIFTPEEISGMILSKMKETAEAFLGYEVKDAVITVPAYFTDAQRQATKDAGEIAGLNVLQILNEPMAAALAYGLDKNLKGERNVLIYDIGGGTFDVSILTVKEGSSFEVRATAGDTHLGGQDFDYQMLNYFVEEFLRMYKKDLGYNADAIWQLRTACEQAKQTLSYNEVARIDIKALHDNIDFHSTITRAKFEEICQNLFQSTLEHVEEALAAAKMDKSEIDEVVLVGGSTRIPKIQIMLRDFFEGKVLNKSINPDEAVAYGAAIQAAILAGDKSQALQDVLLEDVAPLSLGVRTAGGTMRKIIERNSRIPCKRSQTFTTCHDNQHCVAIDVLEGERKRAREDNKLGGFRLSGIPPAPKGVPQINVTFEIDSNGILNVSAKEENTGKEEAITITNDKGRLSKLEIERMTAEAKAFRLEDRKRKENVAARSEFERYIFTVKRIAESAPTEKFCEFDKNIVKFTCAEMIQWLSQNPQADKEQVGYKFSEAQKVLQPRMMKLYTAGDFSQSLAKNCGSNASYFGGDFGGGLCY